MKKLALALVCMFSVAFFASCTKTIEHPEPSIAVMTGEHFVTGTVDNPTIIDFDDENAENYKYGFHVESNAETKKELASLIVTWEWTDSDGNVDSFCDTIDLTGKTSYDYSDYIFEQEKATITLYDMTVKAVVTDVDNQSNTATIAYKIQMEEVALISHTIEWVRRGQNVLSADEMAQYGLQWTGSYKDVMATIEPLNDDVILYLCDGDDFDDIVYMSDKNTYFSNLAETTEPIQKYRNITTNHDDDYNDMLAVVYGEDLFLIHITYADIETGTYGTQITITGAAK